jgi:hypothetical protein
LIYDRHSRAAEQGKATCEAETATGSIGDKAKRQEWMIPPFKSISTLAGPSAPHKQAGRSAFTVLLLDLCSLFRRRVVD